MQAWGLIVLLVSKAAGQALSTSDIKQEKCDDILHSQRALAEITGMIHASHLVHQGLLNLQPLIQGGSDLSKHSDMTFGNKIAILSGDYILSVACAELAALRNQELVELILSSVRDFAESEFIGDRDEQNNPLPSKPMPCQKSPSNEIVEDENFVSDDMLQPMNKANCMGIPEKEWALRHILSAGSLLGKSCQGALKLAGHPVEFQKNGYLLGKHFSLARQASLDLEPFQSNKLPGGATFSLVSAPVLFHLDYDPSLYTEIEKGCISVENVDYAKVHSEVIKGPGLEKTKDLQLKHSLDAMRFLNLFPPSDARTVLQNIILAMQEI